MSTPLLFYIKFTNNFMLLYSSNLTFSLLLSALK
nr:MAG TPA: hypothetical protein [Caudoviricetes sp.]